jgi:hypothetical protein
MFEVEIAACRARIFRVDVQIRVEAHASYAFVECFSGASGENQRAL